jgi:hypothetical protein
MIFGVSFDEVLMMFVVCEAREKRYRRRKSKKPSHHPSQRLARHIRYARRLKININLNRTSKTSKLL